MFFKCCGRQTLIDDPLKRKMEILQNFVAAKISLTIVSQQVRISFFKLEQKFATNKRNEIEETSLVCKEGISYMFRQSRETSTLMPVYTRGPGPMYQEL